LLYFVQSTRLQYYRDKKVVGVFVRFSCATLHPETRLVVTSAGSSASCLAVLLREFETALIAQEVP
jgi:hypothetical protein